MTTTDLARACAEAIQLQVGRADTRTSLLDQISHLVEGALNRALDDQTRSVSEVLHTHASLGAVDITVTKSTQGVSLECDITRPREPGESYEDAAAASARAVAEAYKRALMALVPLGLMPGKAAKGEGQS